MKTRIITMLTIVTLLGVPHFAYMDNAARTDILQLNDQIVEKKAQIKSLQDQIKKYQNRIDDLQSTEVSLANELAIMENRIAQVELDIQSKQVEIEETTLELRELDAQVGAAEERMVSDRLLLGNLIRQIEHEDERTALETFFLNNNLSELFNRAQFLEDLQGDLLKTVKNVQEAKASLEQARVEREEKNRSLRTEKDNLKIEEIRLSDARETKIYLMDQTRNSEFQFKNLLGSLRNEELAVNSDLSSLESKTRERLSQSDRFPVGDVVLSWPVIDRTITTLYHDPDYPFRRVFEHPGLDIRARQGTPVRAAAPGYVLKVRDAGYGYSYIILLHASGISTVYGHLSRLDADVDTYVERGDVIGLSGAMPGTRGAGPFTTGPHLHFEVRVNGIPADPQDYLLN